MNKYYCRTLLKTCLIYLLLRGDLHNHLCLEDFKTHNMKFYNMIFYNMNFVRATLSSVKCCCCCSFAIVLGSRWYRPDSFVSMSAFAGADCAAGCVIPQGFFHKAISINHSPHPLPILESILPIHTSTGSRLQHCGVLFRHANPAAQSRSERLLGGMPRVEWQRVVQRKRTCDV